MQQSRCHTTRLISQLHGVTGDQFASTDLQRRATTSNNPGEKRRLTAEEDRGAAIQSGAQDHRAALARAQDLT
jgi:hypothetical protein